MAKYRIIIENATTQVLEKEFDFKEKTSWEAKAKAYAYGQEECAKLPDGEHVCTLLVKQPIFGGYKRDNNMPVYSYRVSNGNAHITTQKLFFGGEADALRTIKNFITTIAQFLAKALIENPENTHLLFEKQTSLIVDAIDTLLTKYHPEYLSNVLYTNTMGSIKSEIQDELMGYNAYKNDNSMYSSIVNKAYTSIAATLSGTFMNCIALV